MPHKLTLNPFDLKKRRRYCHWLLYLLVKSPRYINTKLLIFVMSDEIPIYIGGPTRHKERITTKKGAPAHEFAKQMIS